MMEDAVRIAKNSDCVLLFVGTSNEVETEGADRQDLILPAEQDELIRRVAEVNKNVVVVLSTGSPVVMDKWINSVDGIVEMWFAGSEGGNAIADVLLGNYNPSGKLPVTFPAKWENCSAFDSYKKYPARTYYDDDIYVGYRHFDKYGIEPLFPFGFGLSYTSFEYSNLETKTEGAKFVISFDLKNAGGIKGEEVPQLYAGKIQPSVDRPVKELKNFSKVSLDPGEIKKVSFVLSKEDLVYYDEKSDGWKTEAGDYSIMIGSSSKDIKLKSVLKLSE
jgi:hypothetical protein